MTAPCCPTGSSAQPSPWLLDAVPLMMHEEEEEEVQ